MATSPWNPPQRPQHVERPWIGMAMLAAVPLLSLILIRMLWSGSSLWFLTVGIILLGIAAVIFLSRRPQDHEYSRQALAPESNRLPLVLTGLGVFFLAMLLLPNFAGGSDNSSPVGQVSQQQQNTGPQSQVSGISQAQVQPTARVQSQVQTQPTAVLPVQQQPSTQPGSESSAPADSRTYVVQDGDTLWDIATSYSVTVDEILAANSLDSPDDLQIGQELTIPPASQDSTADDTTDGGTETQ